MNEWETECPLCGESNAVTVPMWRGEADPHGARCRWGCNLSEQDRDRVAELAEWEIREYARRRDDY